MENVFRLIILIASLISIFKGISHAQQMIQIQKSILNESTDCQIEIVSQLQEQSVEFECHENTIFINQKQVSFSLEMINTTIQTPIVIRSADELNIGFLKIINSHIDISSSNQKHFLDISNVNRLNIGSMIINHILYPQVFGIINTSGIYQFVLQEAEISGNIQLIQANYISLVALSFTISGTLNLTNVYGYAIIIQGTLELNINRLLFQQNSSQKITYSQKQKYLFLSQNSINISTFEIKLLKNQDDENTYYFAKINIFDPINQESWINIDTLSFYSEVQGQRGQLYIFFSSYYVQSTPSQLNKIKLNINKVSYIHLGSNQFFHIYALSLDEFVLDEMKIQIFNKNVGDYMKFLFQVSDIKQVYVKQVQVLENSYLDQNVFVGTITSFIVDKVFIEKGVIISYLFNFNTLSAFQMNELTAQDATFLTQLIHLPNPYYVSIKKVSLQGAIIFQNDMIKIESAKLLEFDEFTVDNLKPKSALFNNEFFIKWIKQNNSFYLNEKGLINIIGITSLTLGTFNNLNINLLQNEDYFTFLEIRDRVNMTITNSIIFNGNSNTNGGCINFLNNTNKNEHKWLYLKNTTFHSCKSQKFGGAISGINILKAENTRVINCTGYLGGGLLLLNQTNLEAVNQITFSENKAVLTDDNYSFGIQEIAIENIYQLNENLVQPYNIIQMPDFIYFGFTYQVELSIKINNIWFKDFNNENRLGNLFYYFQDKRLLIQSTPLQLDNQNYPYFLWNPYSSIYNLNNKTSLRFFFSDLLFVNSYYIQTEKYQLLNGCTPEGMERVVLGIQKSTNLQDFTCRYCDQMKATYNGQCQSCDTDQFSECFADHSVLREGFWRSLYSVDSSDISQCEISPKNCQGGSGIGNISCSQGHIGAQCLDCDINGDFWGSRYSITGHFQCTECNSITLNAIKIIFLITLLIFSIFIIIKTTLERLRNQLFAHYLAKMGIFYIGNSLHKKSLTSTYVKILVFHLSIFIVSNYFTQIDVLSTITSSQLLLYNPLNSSFFSLSCFLTQYKSQSTSIGLVNLMFTFFIPLSLCFLVILLLSLAHMIKKVSFKQATSITFLSFIYIFMITFYSNLLEICLSSFFCLQLDRNLSYSLIDLSLECGNSSQLTKIQQLCVFIFVVFLIVFPISVFAYLIKSRKKLFNVRIMYSFGFLFTEYKSKYYYWEIIRFTVKFLLVLFNTSLKQYTLVVGILLSWLLISYYIALQILNPFISQFLNNLEKASIFISILILQSSIMYSQFELSQEQSQMQQFSLVLFIMIQILNFIFILYIIWLIITSFLDEQILALQQYLKWKWLLRITQPYNFRKINQNIKKFIKCTNSIMFQKEETKYLLTDIVIT